MENVSNESFVTAAGWTTPYPASHLLFYLRPPPRPYSYWTQLRLDARGYKPWIYWIGGGGLIALGLALAPARESGGISAWLALVSILVGGHVLLRWFHAFLNVVQWKRTEPLDVGVIRTLKIHPWWRDLGFADAHRADGTVVEVNVSRVIVDELLKTHGECEVLFLERPWSCAKKYTGFVIAARAVQAEEVATVNHHIAFPGKDPGTIRRWLLMFCLKLCFTIGVVPAYVWWTELLTAEERPLVGRWYAPGGKHGELALWEFDPDRSCRAQSLRRGETTAPAERNAPGRWAAYQGKLVITLPLRGYRDRVARAFGWVPHGKFVEAAFRITDAGTLQTSRGGPWVVFRPVPAGLVSYADLFSPPPAGAEPQP